MRLYKRLDLKYILSFNPRICKRCDIRGGTKGLFARSFNPRICKRCDDEDGNAYKVDFVSIHASVKDAT